MPATWPPFLDCIGTPLVIEPSVDQRSGDASALAAAMQMLLNDKDLRARMGARGRERVESEFSIRRMVAQTTAIYRSVVADPISREESLPLSEAGV